MSQCSNHLIEMNTNLELPAQPYKLWAVRFVTVKISCQHMRRGHAMVCVQCIEDIIHRRALEICLRLDVPLVMDKLAEDLGQLEQAIIRRVNCNTNVSGLDYDA